MKKALLSLLLMTVLGLQAFAQTHKVSGVILDEKGEPVPAASVKIKGTQAGTISDINGRFEIDVPDDAKELTVVALGYGETSIAATGDNLQVHLETSSQVIEDVIINSGYTKTTKENSIGNAGVISADQISKAPVTDITKAIEGRTSGVQVTNGSGQPGSSSQIRIQGFGSINASSDPLIVLDGAYYPGDITGISPNDVESMTVLKDATATSLYGARGANGVIVITTKRGKAGEKPVITFDAKVGFMTRALPDYKILKNQNQYYEVAWDAYRNQLIASGLDKEIAGQIASGKLLSEGNGIVEQLGNYNAYNVANDQLIDPVTGKINPNAQLKYQDDLDKELTRTGVRQDYSLSVSGGNDKSNYYLAGGYLKEQGYVKYTDFERYSIRLNTNTNVTKWLRTGLNVNGSLSNTKYLPGVSSGDATPGGNPFYAARNFAPIYPVYYRNANGQMEIDPLTGANKFDWGDLNNDPESSIGTRANSPQTNVLGSMTLDQNRYSNANLNAITYLEADIYKGLKFKTQLSFNYLGQDVLNTNNQFHGQFAGNGGTSGQTQFNQLGYTWNQFLTYTHKFDGKHNIDLLAGHENTYFRSHQLDASVQGMPLPDNNDLTGASTILGTSSQTDIHTIESYLASATYNYDYKYYLMGTFRRDGSSVFGPDSRWGNFWSIGGAWRISQEAFMSKYKNWLTELKLKASYGIQGNESLAGANNYYAYQALYRLDLPNGASPGAVVSSLPNPDLHWETAKNMNVGVEFALFNRVNGEVNYFQRTNADLLFARPYPTSSGIGSRLENTATMVNKGIEVNLNADIVRTRNFTWNANLNLTHYRNKITKMPEGQDTILAGSTMLVKGQDLRQYYIVESAGVDHKNGDELYYYTDPVTQERKDTSSYQYALATGRTFAGSAIPDVFGALTNTLSYKGFTLSFMLSFAIGGVYYDNVYQDLMGNGGTGGSGWSEDILNRWTESNPSSNLPRVEYQNIDIGNASSRFLISASYLNIKNINLAYNFNSRLISKAGFKSVQLSVSADNVWLFSKRRGMDPQNTFDGASNYYYNPARTVMFGVKLGL